MINWPRRCFLFLIEIYRNLLSPYKLQCCRFYPSCSEYAREAVERHGIIYGGYKAMIRILRCNPFSRGGYDPVAE
jgi:putative membrane protein insertion efficiency factor